MKIRCLTQIRISGMNFDKGEVLDVKDGVAQDLIHRRRVEIYKEPPSEKKPERVPAIPGKRCVAVTGTGRTRVIAPWDDTGWEIWSCSHRIDKYPRTDRHIEIHHPDAIRSGKNYFSWLKANQEKIMLAEPMEELPNARLYPYEAITDRFGKFFSCSISWMIALALLEDVDVIGLWGIDMSKDVLTGREYEFELPSVLYFIGMAVGMGKTVIDPAYSKIFQHTKKPGVTGNQKLNTLFYLGMAAGQGVKFQIPEARSGSDGELIPACDLFELQNFYWKYDPRRKN